MTPVNIAKCSCEDTETLIASEFGLQDDTG